MRGMLRRVLLGVLQMAWDKRVFDYLLKEGGGRRRILVF